MCRFEDCTNKAVSANLCAGHRHHRDQHKALKPLRKSHPAEVTRQRNTDGEKRCPGCETWQAETNFRQNRNRDSIDGFDLWCRSCTTSRQRITKFGVTAEKYEEMLEAQNGLCALCLEPPGLRPMSVDHDHRCCPDRDRTCGDCVRGLLCHRCNLGLGQLRDRVDNFQRAIAYLEYFDVELDERARSV
ncbi:endonuclease VII domain-containing protein [Paractinoplanes atraurantiacus]|uniref:endonuclease VII domain-containing protein n=1 Tax=Paractinoplanes atraurantiacus TaxID=1036182 RepID=UPI000BE2785A